MTPATDRAAINRANAEHSTGPKTPEGKKVASLNAVRHGLTGQMVVMHTEDLEAYNRHVASFTGEYHPQGATEVHLVQALADASWRLNRAAALETNILTYIAFGAPGPASGAVSMGLDFERHSKELANLSIHTQRLSRQFERTVTLLRELQQARCAEAIVSTTKPVASFLQTASAEPKNTTQSAATHGGTDGFRVPEPPCVSMRADSSGPLGTVKKLVSSQIESAAMSLSSS